MAIQIQSVFQNSFQQFLSKEKVRKFRFLIEREYKNFQKEIKVNWDIRDTIRRRSERIL